MLFLDEAPEFNRGVLDALRQPLEDGEVRLRRSGGETHYPARVQLVLAANPCPCARPEGDQRCDCSQLVRRRYVGRLSGPLLDRIDVQVKLLPVASSALLSDLAAEPSTVVAKRVAAAREAATARWPGGVRNADVSGRTLRERRWRLPRTVTGQLARALDHGGLSARGYDRVLKTAWSIADLDGRARPDAGDVSEALELRKGTLL